MKKIAACFILFALAASPVLAQTPSGGGSGGGADQGGTGAPGSGTGTPMMGGNRVGTTATPAVGRYHGHRHHRHYRRSM